MHIFRFKKVHEEYKSLSHVGIDRVTIPNTGSVVLFEGA